MKKTTEHKNKIINFSFYQKKKIYNDFHAIIYKEFNKSISDINYFFKYDNNHLFEVLEEAYDDGGPIKMREEIGYTIQSFKSELSQPQEY
jgi:hypothetical protein